MTNSTTNLQKKCERLWVALEVQPRDWLGYLDPLDRDHFELLDL